MTSSNVTPIQTNRSPFVGHSALVTLENCRDVARWLAFVDDSQGDEEAQCGRALVLHALADALTHAEAQLDQEREPTLRAVPTAGGAA